MTAEQLEALSKAATQGVWVHTFRGGDSSEGDISCGEHSILTVNGGNYAQWRDAPDGGEAEFKANGDFACALVNLYRTGQLVMADDAAVEREQRCPNCGVRFSEVVDVDAHLSAIAAMGGKP